MVVWSIVQWLWAVWNDCWLIVKGSGADEAEESWERREGEAGAAAAWEATANTRQGDDDRQTEVCSISSSRPSIYCGIFWIFLVTYVTVACSSTCGWLGRDLKYCYNTQVYFQDHPGLQSSSSGYVAFSLMPLWMYVRTCLPTAPEPLFQSFWCFVRSGGARPSIWVSLPQFVTKCKRKRIIEIAPHLAK